MAKKGTSNKNRGPRDGGRNTPKPITPQKPKPISITVHKSMLSPGRSESIATGRPSGGALHTKEDAKVQNYIGIQVTVDGTPDMAEEAATLAQEIDALIQARYSQRATSFFSTQVQHNTHEIQLPTYRDLLTCVPSGAPETEAQMLHRTSVSGIVRPV